MFCPSCDALVAQKEMPPECACRGPRWIVTYKDKFCESCYHKARKGEALSPCAKCVKLRSSLVA